jgi:hypothetical protein
MLISQATDSRTGILRRVHSESIHEEKLQGQREAPKNEAFQRLCRGRLREKGLSFKGHVPNLLVGSIRVCMSSGFLYATS